MSAHFSQLWFAPFNAFSGQIIFERWTIGFYNLVHACACVCVSVCVCVMCTFHDMVCVSLASVQRNDKKVRT